MAARVTFLSNGAGANAAADAAAVAAAAAVEASRQSSFAKAGLRGAFGVTAQALSQARTQDTFLPTNNFTDLLATPIEGWPLTSAGAPIIISGLSSPTSTCAFLRQHLLGAMAEGALMGSARPSEPELESAAASLGFALGAPSAGGSGHDHGAHIIIFTPPPKRFTTPRDAAHKFESTIKISVGHPSVGSASMPLRYRPALDRLAALAGAACVAFVGRSRAFIHSGETTVPYTTFFSTLFTHGTLVCVSPTDSSLDPLINSACEETRMALERAVTDQTSRDMAALLARPAHPSPPPSLPPQGTKRPAETAAAAAAAAGGGAQPQVKRERIPETPTIPWCMTVGSYSTVLGPECPIHRNNSFTKAHACAQLGFKRATCHQLPELLGGKGTLTQWNLHRCKAYLDKFSRTLPAVGQSAAAANPTMTSAPSE